MIRKAEIVFEYNLEKGVGASFGSKLEVSLPCTHCQRNRRTVVFHQGKDPVRCCPGSAKTSKKHPHYPGRIVTCESLAGPEDPFNVHFLIEYEYEPFVDAKYGKPSNPIPSWGRSSVDVMCPKCYVWTEGFTQSNLVRPRSTSCPCGQLLFTETEERPIIRWLDPGSNTWNQLPSRWSADDFKDDGWVRDS